MRYTTKRVDISNVICFMCSCYVSKCNNRPSIGHHNGQQIECMLWICIIRETSEIDSSSSLPRSNLLPLNLLSLSLSLSLSSFLINKVLSTLYEHIFGKKSWYHNRWFKMDGSLDERISFNLLGCLENEDFVQATTFYLDRWWI